jgi:hypothetical protein
MHFASWHFAQNDSACTLNGIMAHLGHRLFPVAAWCIFSAGSSASSSVASGLSEASTNAAQQVSASLPHDMGQRFSSATAKVRAATDIFWKLRTEIGRSPDLAASIVLSLKPEEVSLLNGSAPASEALTARLQALQVKGIELSGKLTDGDLTEMSKIVPSLAAELETLALDLDAHFALIRELALSQLSSGERDRFAAVVVGPDGRTSSARSSRKESNVHISDTALSVSQDLAKLNEVARSLAGRADVSMLAEARRLGARFAKLETEESHDVERWNDLREVVRTAVVRAEKLLKEPSRSGSSNGISGTGSSLSQVAWQPGQACTTDAVKAAAGHFDAVVPKYRSVLKAMLPPEVENLHRIIHTIEVMKTSLLAELSGSQPPELTGLQPGRGCERYFAAVGQFETDLRHYRGLMAKKRNKRRRRKQQGRQQGLPSSTSPSSTLSKTRPALSALRF